MEIKIRGRLTIKHLALGTQSVALRDQIINLLPSLQHALDGLVQHDLSLVQFLLDLHDAVRLLWILVLHDVFLQLGKRQRRIGRSPRRARVLCEELVDNFREELVRYQARIVVVGDDNATDALRATVGVERVVCNLSEWIRVYRRADLPCSSTSCRWPGRVRSATVLLNRVINSP
jgi:hypothetical protein